MASVGGFASSKCAVSCQYEHPEHARQLRLTDRHSIEALGNFLICLRICIEGVCVCQLYCGTGVVRQRLLNYGGLHQKSCTRQEKSPGIG